MKTKNVLLLLVFGVLSFVYVKGYFNMTYDINLTSYLNRNKTNRIFQREKKDIKNNNPNSLFWIEGNNNSISTPSVKTFSFDNKKLTEKVKKKKSKRKNLKKRKEWLKKLLALLEEKDISLINKDMLRETINTYSELERYPLNMIKLFKGAMKDPLISKHEKDISKKTIIHKKESPPPEDPTHSEENPNMVLASSEHEKYNYVIGEDDITFKVGISGKDGRVPVNVEGEVFNEKKEYVTTLQYFEDDDLTYMANFVAPDMNDSDLAGNYFVKIKATSHNKGENIASAYMFDSFSLQYRNYKFKRRIKEKLTINGDLEFNLYYQIYKTGNYIIQGTLYDKSDNPIAFVERPYELKKGRQWINIDFHGFLLSSQKISGPLILKHLSLKYVKNNFLTESSGLETPKFETKSYHWSEFNPYPDYNVVYGQKLMALELFLQSL